MRQSVVAGRTQKSRDVGMMKSRASRNFKAKRERVGWLETDIHSDEIGKRSQRYVNKRKSRRDMKNIRRKDVLAMQKTRIGRGSIRVGHCFVKHNMKCSFDLTSGNIIKNNVLHALRIPKEKTSSSIRTKFAATGTGWKCINPATKSPKVGKIWELTRADGIR